MTTTVETVTAVTEDLYNLPSGTEFSFRVEAKVDSNGDVTIGCQTFDLSSIRDVAQEIILTKRPTVYSPGDVLRLTEAGALSENYYGNETGDVFIVEDHENYYGEPSTVVWNVRAGTHAPQDWWEETYDAKFELIFRASDGKALLGSQFD